MANISIITIGDELLIGQVVDTNSAWMANQLNAAGMRVIRRVAVGDVKSEIIQALDEESRMADAVLITGGLGPTADDITKPLLCEYFGHKLKIDPAALDNVKHLFLEVFKRPLTERNIKQAEVPDGCTVIQNKRGTAPGMIFEKEGKLFVSMPGVPYEMMGMMTDTVIPLLSGRFNVNHIEHRTVITFGIGESMIADKISEFEHALPPYIKLAYLPHYGLVRLRLTGTHADPDFLREQLDQFALDLQDLVKDNLISGTDLPMEQIVGDLLLKRKETISTAESCTGGYIAHLLTSKAGSSAYFEGSVVSYSNSIKERVLGVKHDTLGSAGAVSEETVREMLAGLLKLTQTTYGIAVSGIMGPGGGSDEKPVGTVWIAVGSQGMQRVQRFHFRFDRQRNIQVTALNALNLLRDMIAGLPTGETTD